MFFTLLVAQREDFPNCLTGVFVPKWRCQTLHKLGVTYNFMDVTEIKQKKRLITEHNVAVLPPFTHEESATNLKISTCRETCLVACTKIMSV